MMQSSDLGRLFAAKSLAIVGASPNEEKVGSRLIRYLTKFGYDGEIYAVNPAHESVEGLICYPTIADVPGVVDLALLAVPSSQVLVAAEEAAMSDVGGAVVYAAGFAETSLEGAEKQRKIHEISQATGMRILGPNCQGFVNVRQRLCATWSSALAGQVALEMGNIACLSQSGAVAVGVYAEIRSFGKGLSFWISTGNEADITVADALDFVLEDEDTYALCLYIESIRDGVRFRRALSRAADLAKPVIVLKGGLTPSGAHAAATHTGALAGDQRVYRGFLEQCGAVVVQDIHELAATAVVAADLGIGRRPTRPAILTNSGGLGVMAADVFHSSGLPLSRLSPAVVDDVSSVIPDFIQPNNPVDVGPLLNEKPGLLTDLLLALHDKGGYDAFLICLLALRSEAGYGVLEILESIARFRDDADAVVVTVLMACDDDAWRYARELGLGPSADLTRASWALANLSQVALGTRSERKESTHASRQETAITNAREATSFVIAEHEAKSMLKSMGIPIPKGQVAFSPDEAVQIAERIGFPVVAKAAVPLLHKSELGAVITNIADGILLERAFEQIYDAVNLAGLEAKRGVLVEEMVTDGIEAIVGLRHVPGLGVALLFGMGGILTELYDDVTVRILPLSREDILDMVMETRGFQLLKGTRGNPPRDVEALIDFLGKIADLLGEQRSNTFEEIEFNPVAILAPGSGVRVLDVAWRSRPVVDPG